MKNKKVGPEEQRNEAEVSPCDGTNERTLTRCQVGPADRKIHKTEELVEESGNRVLE